jgi:hypothetical protein
VVVLAFGKNKRIKMIADDYKINFHVKPFLKKKVYTVQISIFRAL